jgi:hypothetical protein
MTPSHAHEHGASLEGPLDVRDVAAAWGVVVSTVQRWARTGRLAGAYKTPTGKYRFTTAALPPSDGGRR